MWDFFETVRHRHSVRKYQSDMGVEDEKLHTILEMACAAPSAGDLQSYHVVVVREQATRDQLRIAADNQEFVSQAPACLIFCSDASRSARQFGDRGASLYCIQDATIAAAYAQLAIVAAGMASTWIGNFDESMVCEQLQLGTDLKPVAMLSVGYPAELPALTARRQMHEMVDYR